MFTAHKWYAIVIQISFLFIIYLCSIFISFGFTINIGCTSPPKIIYVNSYRGILQLGINLRSAPLNAAGEIELDRNYGIADIQSTVDELWFFKVWQLNDEMIISCSYMIILLLLNLLIGIILWTHVFSLINVLWSSFCLVCRRWTQ